MTNEEQYTEIQNELLTILKKSKKSLKWFLKILNYYVTGNNLAEIRDFYTLYASRDLKNINYLNYDIYCNNK